jgi:NADPH:quinone reductase-like Zn-dependent oxidoreductase
VILCEQDIAVKPANISFEQAAAIPTIGTAALQIFDGLAAVGKGTEVLINGASGGVLMLRWARASLGWYPEGYRYPSGYWYLLNSEGA